MSEELTRECRRCGETKPIEDFKRAGAWRIRRCRTCLRADERKQAQAKRDQLRPASPPFADLGLPPVSLAERRLAVEGSCRGSSSWLRPGLHQTELEERRVVCRQCPVREECRDVCDSIERAFGVSFYRSQDLTGVWGGEGPADRANRRLQARAAA